MSTTTRKTTPPDRLAEALAMRQAGFTVISISEELGLSVRTLHRHFAAHGVVKGAVKQELVEAAKQKLLSVVTSNDVIREKVAGLVHDDLAHAAHLRSIMIEATEHLKASNLRDAVLVARASAALSTALKNTSDMIRHSIRIDDLEDDAEELPVLRIVGLTPEQVAALRDEPVSGMAPANDDTMAVVMTEPEAGAA